MKYRFDDYEIDSEGYRVERDGEVVAISPLAFDLLLYLLEHRDRVVTRRELLDILWHDKVVTEDALGARLRDARKAVGDDGQRQAVIRTHHGRGYQFVAQVQPDVPDDGPVTALSQDDFEAPSVAVLPFTNLSPDPVGEFFVDGTTDEIITGLSRIPGLFVIAANSTRVYKGQVVDVRRVGREQGVSHVLQGSIRKAGQYIRVTAQLIDAASGMHVWASRFQCKDRDIFAVQDEIMQKVVTELQVKLVTGEYARAWSAGTRSIEAWELLLRARTHMAGFARDDCMIAANLLEQVLELDENYAAAWAMLGHLSWMASNWGWSGDRDEALERAFDYAQKTLAIEPDHPDAHAILGHILMVRGRHAEAVETVEKAVQAAPGDSRMNAFLGNVLVDAGRIREGIQRMHMAIRLCPNPLPWYLLVLGAALHLDDQQQEAIAVLQKAAAAMPDSVLPRLWLASALVDLGRTDEARAMAREVLERDAAFSAHAWAASFTSATHARLVKNVRSAGFEQ